MNRSTIAVTGLALTVLFGCSREGGERQATQAAAPAVVAEGCQASAQSAWPVTDGAAYRIEAHAFGPNCAGAVIALVVFDAAGAAQWASIHHAEHTFEFVEVETQAQMQDAVSRWIALDQTMPSTGKLPEWSDGADAPGGEFPFFPAESYAARDSYAVMRNADHDMFCYVQGMESMKCVALIGGRIEEVGVQSFPG